MEVSYFVLTLPLQTERWQEDRLQKRFEINRRIYNALLNGGLKRYAQMVQTRKYRALVEELDQTQEEKVRKQIYKELDQLVERYRLRRYDLTKDAAQYRQYFKENTDAPIVQNLAVQAHKALYALISRQAKQVHFRKEGELNCLAGKTNKTSIRYQDGYLVWKELRIPVGLKENRYEREALEQEIRYCRLRREKIRGKYHYSIQIILKGKCPVKKRIPLIVADTVGIDIGMRQIAVVSDHEAFLERLPRRQEELERKRVRLARRMERSRRYTHPENYGEDGRIKKGALFHNTSNHYKKWKDAYLEAGRKQNIYRLEEQRLLAEKLMKAGVCFHVEELAYAKMKQKRQGSTRWIGKEVEAVALAAFLRRLQWKMEQQGRRLIFINPVEAKAGSLNHLTGWTERIPYTRKFRTIGGVPVEKHLYSAFLLKHADPVNSKVHLESCRNEYEAFLRLCAGVTAEQAGMAG